MTCHTAWALLDLYKEGRLSAARSAEIEAHIGRCPSCAALAAPAKPLEAPKAPASLKERLRSLSAQPPAVAVEPPKTMRALPTAAFALVVGWLGLLWLAHAATARWPAAQGDTAGEPCAVRRLP